MSTPNSQSNFSLNTPMNTPDRPGSQSDISFQLDDDTWVDLDNEKLKSDQDNIDKVLKFLLNHRPIKKQPGRPPKNADNLNRGSSNTLKVPDSVSESLKSVVNIGELHAGVLLDYLMKVNSLNKRLISHCDSLTKKFNDLNDKFNSFEATTKQNSTVTTPPLPDVSSHADSQLVEQYINKNENLQLKLDSLEQGTLSNVLVCSGSSIVEYITDSDDKSLTEKVVDKVKEFLPGVESSIIDRVIPIGKEKKTFKVICTNISVKNDILKSARMRKVPNVYFTEYLTPYRNTLYYKLRQIKKKYPFKIFSVYTRNGNLFYKNVGDDKYHRVKSNEDVIGLEARLSV